jgi:DNA-directed RNA polymerase specialized sigma24 family protein
MAHKRGRAAEDDFAEFHRRTLGYVLRVLRGVGIHREAERCEVAQEVYFAAYLKRATRNPAVPELAWLGCLARNIGRRYRALARTRKEQPVNDPENMNEPLALGLNPEEMAIGRAQLFTVMEGLADDLREVFEMARIDCFSITEIAAALRKPAGTVSTLLRRANEEVEAAIARLKASEQRAMLPMLPALGAGDWSGVTHFFEPPTPEMEEQVWRGVCRRIASAAAAGSAAAGAGLAAKGALFGSGAVLGGGAVAAAFLLVTPPAPAPTISRAPEVASVALASTSSATAAPAAPAPTMAAAPSSTTTGAPAATTATGLDPREQQILSRAESAIVAGRLSEARAALAEYDQLFPGARAKLRADRARVGGKLTAATNQPSVPDAGRAPHRLMGTDD